MVKSRSKNSVFKSLSLILVGVVVMYLIFLKPSQTQYDFDLTTPPNTPTPTPVAQSLGLKQVVDQALAGTAGSYGIVVKNLKTGEYYAQNENRKYETGSLYKLWVMAEAFNQIEQGQLKEDEVLSGDVADLNSKYNIPQDSADLTEGEIDIPVSDAITQMITISHNYDALLLTDRVSLASVSAFLTENGLSNSQIGDGNNLPTTTSSDTAEFLEKLYYGKLADPDNTKQMLELLKSQQLNNKLPRYLPEEVQVAHKTGELDNFSHDAGIVATPQGDYIIVVLSETDAPDLADDRIAQLSKNVYEYFMKGGE